MTDAADDKLSLEIDVETCAAWRRQPEGVALLDVREPWELEVARLDDSINVPMRAVADRVGELPRDRPLVVMCHHGARSLRVALWLRQAGVANAVSLAGGIDAWARRIDPSVPLY